MTITLGLFDIFQVDPTEDADHGDVYRRRLDDLAYSDDLGFAIAMTAERHYLTQYRCPAAVAWIGAASQRTRRMRLGALAFTLPLHAPVQLAEEIAVLDQISGGRLEVGIGLGHRVEELRALGVDPEQRIEIFQERLAIMEGLWSGHQVAIESEHNTVRDVSISPLPAQRPHPPLWYAGVDPGAAQWAGGNGLSLAVGFAPSRDLLPATAAFRAGVIARQEVPNPSDNRPGGGRIALMRHTLVAESDEAVRTEMIDDLYRLRSLAAKDSGDRADRRRGAEEEQARLIREEVFIAGAPEQVAQQIAFAGAALGITDYFANVYGAGIDDERVRRSMRLLAGPVREVLAVTAVAAD